jgi:hypothetical protein
MTTSAPSTFSAERNRTQSLVVPTGIATVLVSSVFTYLGAHSWQEAASMIALATVTAAAVYGLVVPRALDKEAAPRVAMTMSAVAALATLPAFWTGLPLVLGASGALVGYAGRGAARGSGLSIAAMLIGVLTVIGYLAIYIVDGIIFGNTI